MIRMIGGAAAAAMLCALAGAGTASAAINRTADVNASTRTYAWDGVPTPSVSAFFNYAEADPAGSCDGFRNGLNGGPMGPFTVPPTTVPPTTVPEQTVGPFTVPSEDPDPVTTPEHTTDPVIVPATPEPASTPEQTVDSATVPSQTYDPEPTPEQSTDPVTVPSQTVPGATVPGQTVGPVQRPEVIVPHSAFDYCDTTFVKLPQGKLEITMPEAGDGITEDWDMFVYTSNRHKEFGQLVGKSVEVGAPETLTIPIATGYYLINAVPFTSTAAGPSGSPGYTGLITYTPTQDTP